jgi:uncharacterized membrane protein
MLLMLLPIYKANCQNYVEYSIQINSDGSALWKITSFSDLNASIDTLNGFQNKVSNLINSASAATSRDMSVNEDSLQINTTISSESKTTEYSFLWQNFSIIKGNQIIFGDVFQVSGFFSQLYGDAALQISYPSTFSVKSVTPVPYQRDDTAKMLNWARTQDLVSSQTNVILIQTSFNNSNQNKWQEYIIVAVVAAIGVTLSFVGFYRLKRRKQSPSSTMIPVEFAEVETEEDKILNLLKASGGSVRQSTIVDQCRFSKAKTSQLLTVLEKKGIITRYKRGRDKIVNLVEREKSE